MTVEIRSHVDTSGSGGLAEGIYSVTFNKLPDYVSFFDSGAMTFHLPINQFEGLNREINRQIFNLYDRVLAVEAAAGGGGSGLSFAQISSMTTLNL